MRGFKPQEVANTAWAFATAGVSSPPLFAAIAAEAEKQMRGFNPQSLANTAWAFATAGVSSPTLFKAIAAEAEKQVRRFSPQGLSITAWGFAALGVVAPALFKVIVSMLPSLMKESSASDRSQIIIFNFALVIILKVSMIVDSAPTKPKNY